MDKEFLINLIESVKKAFERLVNELPEIKKPFIRENGSLPLNEVSMAVGIIGREIDGDMVLTMDKVSAVKLAGLLMGKPESFLNNDARSALLELTNVLSAAATHSLTHKGYLCDITTPRIHEGRNMKIDLKEGAVAVAFPMLLTIGAIEMNIAIRQVP